MNINRVEIRNFKSIKNFYIKDCSTINIITGENGSGKSTLLEALFLFMDRYSTDAFIKQLTWRSGPEVVLKTDSVFLPFFRDFNFKNSINIKINNEELSISYDEKLIRTLASNVINPNISGTSHSGIRMKLHKNKKQKADYNLTVAQDGIHRNGNIANEQLDTAIYMSHRLESIKRLAHDFSEIEKIGEKSLLIDSLRLFDESIIDLSLLIQGNRPELFVKSEKFSQMVPLTLLGEGINRYAIIMSAILSKKSKLIFIDELENGFHFTLLPKLWEAILNFASGSDLQFFITTHSAELISGIKESITKSPDKFTLTRILNSSQCKIFVAEDILNALEEKWEVR